MGRVRDVGLVTLIRDAMKGGAFPMKLEERLGANKYYVDETSPHILCGWRWFLATKSETRKRLSCRSIYITREWRFSL